MTISLRDVRWNASGRVIIDGISMTVEPAQTLGLVGPNGSGKSTLLRLICRLRRPASGVIRLDETDIARIAPRDIARRLALVEQQATTDAEITVLDVVRLGRIPHRGPLSSWSQRDDAAVEDALHHVGMAERRLQPWRTLSGGERQRVHIARALAQTPSELLLDEPTNHLDIRHQLEILSLVRTLPVTSVIALHDLNLAAMFCDAVAVLKEGRVVAAGAPEQILTEAMIRDVFAVQAHVELTPNNGRKHIRFSID